MILGYTVAHNLPYQMSWWLSHRSHHTHLLKLPERHQELSLDEREIAYLYLRLSAREIVIRRVRMTKPIFFYIYLQNARSSGRWFWATYTVSPVMACLVPIIKSSLVEKTWWGWEKFIETNSHSMGKLFLEINSPKWKWNDNKVKQQWYKSQKVTKSRSMRKPFS